MRGVTGVRITPCLPNFGKFHWLAQGCRVLTVLLHPAYACLAQSLAQLVPMWLTLREYAWQFRYGSPEFGTFCQRCASHRRILALVKHPRCAAIGAYSAANDRPTIYWRPFLHVSHGQRLARVLSWYQEQGRSPSFIPQTDLCLSAAALPCRPLQDELDPACNESWLSSKVAVSGLEFLRQKLHCSHCAAL
jgi:hypothetical protein